MNANLTELIFILDRSGSMQHLTNETIGGFNSLIEKQRNEGNTLLTTVLFDNSYELLYDHVDIRNVPALTQNEYYARGSTALLDAIGKTIDSVGMRLANTPEEERPGKVIFTITTDGYENASEIYSLSQIKEMITRQRTIYKWEFVFFRCQYRCRRNRRVSWHLTENGQNIHGFIRRMQLHISCYGQIIKLYEIQLTR